jgi:hypothetical protein
LLVGHERRTAVHRAVTYYVAALSPVRADPARFGDECRDSKVDAVYKFAPNGKVVTRGLASHNGPDVPVRGPDRPGSSWS